MIQALFRAAGARAFVAVAALAALLAVQDGQAQAKAPRSRAPVTVNFVNADIEAVTRAFAAMIERAIVVDPRVKGTVTVYSEQPQSVREAYASYLSALRGLGFAVVESGGLLKVVPEADAKLQTGTVSVGEVGVRGDQVITQIFTLRYENANNLVAVLRPLISANNTINANPGSNSLVITDYAENLGRLAKIIAALDNPSGTEVEVVPLQHAVAADLAPLVQRLSEGGSAAAVPGAQGSGALAVVADSRNNALLVRANNPARLAAARATIARLDRPSTLVGAGGGMWVVHLKHADAARLATVVRAAFGAVGGSGGGAATASAAPAPTAAVTPGATATGTGGGTVTASAQPSTGGFIQADPATNSLIITAPEPLYKQVRALIDQLDSRRAQVYIESMIVEVSPSDSADFGFQWQGLLHNSGDSSGLVGGTNFSATGRPSIIETNVSAAQNQVNVGAGLNIGLLRTINGITSLAAVARVLQSQSDTNIVSTPNLITLDNEEAKIVVGENVPFITGQFTQTGGATTNPFQTIERKDVGITLRIRPQIGENGAIRMQIFQEQSAVQPTTAAGTSNAGPSTTKRSIEGTVSVEDGQILVLGGLIEDRFVTTKNKVPLLGDIPFLGALFRSESRERKRTNLMVFLRPIVMRDAESATRFSTDRYEQMRGQQQGAQPAPSVLMPINEAPVLPELKSLMPAAGASAPAPARAP
ncbi:type II secretion system secretin GspD [Rubrivivax sp. A210]|uniref:type II secretion system secretin GspD n=1 Tax=Rubrivivax sp. A210 TaxID=2772301 RepID=UPI001F17ADD3|nr:type II secretion system secretin GspD [Rubrivivax sp. A210]